jgi:mannose/cellobiose epimerase-like protein (N-acyl-D-glucosamine 2-epimerase family)
MPSIFTGLRNWMFEEALPFWSSEGIDRVNGGYVEHFTLDGEPYTETKRVFVVCRQIYVFAHAAALGFPEGAALAAHGYKFLEKAWLPETGGWARRLDAGGRVIDETPDLYVLSFSLFALAWMYRLTRDPQMLIRAHKTLDFIEKRMSHVSGHGFLHEYPATGPRQQNPHMHLVEGLLALAEFSGEPRFFEAADNVVNLFQTRFFNRRSRTLAEFFAEDFGPLDLPEGRLTEPGHQFEWAWILNNYQRLTGRDTRETIISLHETAERHGVDPRTYATYNCVREDGAVMNAGSRIWPNTERMKAAVALFELTGRPPSVDLEQSGRLLLDAYLAPALQGRWLDNLDASGKPTADKIPASSLYHLFLAFAEALRVEPLVLAASKGAA